MVRDLSGRVAALWRAMAALAAGRRPGAARETETMKAHGLAGETRSPESVPDGPLACDDLLWRAMTSLGIDADDVALREGPLLRDMRLVCRSCDARSRCRRDLGTGDFARRYRHYCPNAENLSLIASGIASRAARRT